MRTALMAVVAAAVVFALVLALRAGAGFSIMAMRVTGSPGTDATLSIIASPTAAATPQTAQLPLYTPIPVSAARNVVGRVTIELTDRGFIPSRFEQAINQPITFTLVNTGTRRHNFSIDEIAIDIDVDPGETKTFTVESPRRLGHYTYYSDTPDDRALSMMGTMTIFI